tara:strand:- start:268 stop:2031 length:1764 start_codon:yes stop_codon:yes gene_type:complete
MADVKISELTALTSPDGAEELVVNDGGTTKKITITNATSASLPKAGGTMTGALNVQHAASAVAKFQSTATNGGYVTYVGGSTTYIGAPLSFLGTGTASDFGIIGTGANNFVLGTSSAEKMRIDNSGKVGIGTSSPTDTLHVQGTLNVQPSTYNKISSYFSGSYISGFKFSDLNGGIWYDAGVDDLTISASHANSQLIMEAGGAERMRIDSSGNVGIGVTPEATHSLADVLQVGGTALIANWEDAETYVGENVYISTAGTYKYLTTSHASLYNQNSGKHVFNIAPSGTADAAISWTTAMTIDNAGLTNINDATASTYNQVLTVISKCTSRAGVYINQQNASYGHSSYGVIRNDVVRAASNAWNFEVCRSGDGSDTLFKYRGDGNAFADNNWNAGGADYAEYFEWSDGNPSNEDRRGYSVILEGNKIRQALVGETPMGVISGNPSVVGDAAWSKWDGKYLTDDFGTYILEEYTVTEWEAEVIDVEATEDTEATYKTVTKSFQSDKIPVDEIVPSNALVLTEDANGNTFERRTLNSDWNPDTEYVPREDRQEWDTVGLMGKLRVIKGQPVDSRWIKMRDVSDTVEEWLVR